MNASLDFFKLSFFFSKKSIPFFVHTELIIHITLKDYTYIFKRQPHIVLLYYIRFAALSQTVLYVIISFFTAMRFYAYISNWE